MILRPLPTTISGYKPPEILLFFPIDKIKVRAILSGISTELISINSYYISMYIYPIKLLVAQCE